MPQVHSAYYFRVFRYCNFRPRARSSGCRNPSAMSGTDLGCGAARGPPVGALYKKYPGLQLRYQPTPVLRDALMGACLCARYAMSGTALACGATLSATRSP
eukprot:3467261-Rhodomonas_salina.1